MGERGSTQTRMRKQNDDEITSPLGGFPDRRDDGPLGGRPRSLRAPNVRLTRGGRGGVATNGTELGTRLPSRLGTTGI